MGQLNREISVPDFGSLVRRHFGSHLSSEGSNEDQPPPPYFTFTTPPPEMTSSSEIFSTTSSGQNSSNNQPLDLHTLWKLLEEMDRSKDDKVSVGLSSLDGVQDLVTSDDASATTAGGGRMSTWELVVLQTVLLTLLIIVSLLWAFCCKRRCLADQTLVHEMVSLARKISGGSSKDLPPSYSKTDLTEIGLTVDDHLNPPPTYDRAASLIHPERKSGGRMGGGWPGQPVARFCVSSAHSLASSGANNIDHIVDIEAVRSVSTSSGRAVTFSPDLVTGPTERRTRPHSLPLVSVLVHPESRKQSTQSEGGTTSRKPLFLQEADLATPTDLRPFTSASNLGQSRCQPML